MLNFDQKKEFLENNVEIFAYVNQIIPIFWNREAMYPFHFFSYFQSSLLQSNPQVIVKRQCGDIRIAKIVHLTPNSFELADIRYLMQAENLLIMVDDSHIKVIRHTTGEVISKVRHKSDSFFNLAYVYSAATRKLYICYPSEALCSVSMSDLIKLNDQSLSAPEIKECLTFLDNSNNRQQSNYPNLMIFDDQRVILLYYRLYGHKRYLRYRISINVDRLADMIDSVDVNKAVHQQSMDDRSSSLKLTDYEARGIGPNHFIFYTTEIGSYPKYVYFG